MCLSVFLACFFCIAHFQLSCYLPRAFASFKFPAFTGFVCVVHFLLSISAIKLEKERNLGCTKIPTRDLVVPIEPRSTLSNDPDFVFLFF